MQVDKNEFFKEVTLRICSSLDIEEALSHTFEYFEKFIPIDAMRLIYTDLPQARMIHVAIIEREGVHLYGEKFPETQLNEEYVESIKELEAGDASVIIMNRPEHRSDGMLRSFPKLVSCSTLSLQLKIRGQLVGKFVISAEGLDLYSGKDAALLESVREPIAISMSNARQYKELVRIKDKLAEDNRALSTDLRQVAGVEVVGADFGLREVMEQVRQVAQSTSPALLLGETGTGKEVIANAIHLSSPQQKGPMISMQCGAVPETLLDSELFGHEKGAFTGAADQKRGRFERADGGTLFLDEIGELSPEAQIKLLRVLEEKQFERVGGTHTIKVDVRVIAATHRDLDKMVQEGKFREDLWYRLNVLPIRIPPLRLRRGDIPSLVQHFVARKTREMNLLRMPQIDVDTLKRLKAYDWPGNVRELQNVVERALILSDGNQLRFPELGSKPKEMEDQELVNHSGIFQTMDQTIANQIRSVLKHTDGRIDGKYGAAKILRMNPSTLRSRMKKLGIQRK